MPEGSHEAEERASRSSVACNACRVKKQRVSITDPMPTIQCLNPKQCGGEKPVCERCAQLDRDCTWPKQNKRGPAKGYSDALEVRLRETEEVLLKILDNVNADELARVFSSSQLDYITDVGDKDNATDRKAALDYWANYPLRTWADVLRWHIEAPPRVNPNTQDTSKARVQDNLDARETTDLTKLGAFRPPGETATPRLIGQRRAHTGVNASSTVGQHGTGSMRRRSLMSSLGGQAQPAMVQTEYSEAAASDQEEWFPPEFQETYMW